MSRQSCLVCAWRENCSKRFSISDCGSRCPDYSRDISIKNMDDTQQTENNEQNKEKPAK